MHRLNTLHLRHRRRALVTAAAAAFLPVPTLATTYDLTNQTVNLATATYTAADTLNCASTTLTSSAPDLTLAATVNIVPFTPVTTITSAGNITFAAALTGSAYLQKSGAGTLTLSAPSPAYTGAFTLNAGTLRLLHPDALGNDPYRSTGLSLSGGAIDVSGAIPNLPIGFNGGGLANNTTTPVTVGPALSAYSSKLSSFTLGGSGDLTFAAPLAEAGTLTKVGTGTVTYSTVTTFNSIIHVNAGTLRLGVSNPFGSWGGVAVQPSASLDFNGFNIPNLGVTSYGGSFVNNNTSATSTLNFLPFVADGALNLGGAGNMNLTVAAAPFTKAGAGTVILSAPNPSFADTLTLNDGTVRLNNASALGNSSASRFNLNGTASTNGTLDLNGNPAPTGSYTFSGGSLVNNNTAAPSIIGLDALLSGGSYTLGGAGDLSVNRPLSGGTLNKIGTGNLTVNFNGFSTANVNAGTLRFSGPSVSLLFASVATSATLDVNGVSTAGPTFPKITLSSGAALVNNNVATPFTITPAIDITASSSVSLGGAGILNLNNANLLNKIITKIGPGLLTLPETFTAANLILREGALQAERPTQLGSIYSPSTGSPLEFRGGTLRTGPLNLPSLGSYSFPNPWYIQEEGGTIDTTADTTFSATPSGGSATRITTGTLTKTGTATLTLLGSYQSGISFTINQGIIAFPPSNAGPFARGTLTVNANNALSCTGTLPGTGILAVGALAGTADFSSFPLMIRGVKSDPPAYSGTYSAPSLTISGAITDAPALTATGTLNTAVTVSNGTLTLGAGGTTGTATGPITVATAGRLNLNRSDTFTLPATLSGTGTLATLGAGTATVTLSPAASLKLDLHASTLRLAPAGTVLTTPSLTLAPAASLDLTDNALTLTSTPATALRAYLSAHQILSSIPDPAGVHAIGYAPAGSSLRAKLTLIGDANLDGTLNADDYALIDKGFATHADTWWQGDFNYDGTVDQYDYLLIDATYGQASGLSPDLLATRESQFGPAYVNQLLAAVPEPSFLACFFGALPFLSRRRPRRSRFA